MKRFIISIMLFGGIVAVSDAQSEKFIKAMEQKVIAVDTTFSFSGLQDLANAFERIAEAEKDQWLPYYYAALANVQAGNVLMSTASDMMGDNSAVLDPLSSKAETLIQKAEALSPDNSEIFVVKKMVASLQMMGNPMSRYMTYGPIAAEALAKAKELNPENPRIYLLEAQDKYFTPEQYGGDKEEARRLFETAIKMYEAFKPESSIHPSWGRRQAEYFLSEMK